MSALQYISEEIEKHVLSMGTIPDFLCIPRKYYFELWNSGDIKPRTSAAKPVYCYRGIVIACSEED